MDIKSNMFDNQYVSHTQGKIWQNKQQFTIIEKHYKEVVKS